MVVIADRPALSIADRSGMGVCAAGGDSHCTLLGGDSGEGCEYANAADRTGKREFSEWTVMDCQDGYVYTAPVGSFRANNFGLHDVLRQRVGVDLLQI
jgi:hypothetical protein